MRGWSRSSVSLVLLPPDSQIPVRLWDALLGPNERRQHRQGPAFRGQPAGVSITWAQALGLVA